MPERSTDVGKAEARALWKRAIELQVAAERSSSAPSARPPRVPDGFSLEQVVEAAQEAGIAAEYVRVALAERRLPDAEEMRRDRWQARWMRFVTGGNHTIDISRSIGAAPDEVISAFRDVVSRPAFEMVIEDQVGPNPPLEGVLVYRIDGSSSWASSFHGAMFVADVRVVLVTAAVQGDRTVLRLRLPLFEHGVNLAITGAMAGGLGTLGAYGGTVAAGALGAVLAGPIAVGALAGGALGVAGFRQIHRWGQKKGERELQRLLRTVALEVERAGSTASGPA